MGDVTPGIQVDDKHIQVILQITALEGIDGAQGALLVLGQIGRGFVQQCHGLFR